MTSDGIYFDNDVVLKTCVYRASLELVEIGSSESKRPAILNLAKYTLRSKIEKSRSIIDKVAVRKTFDAVLLELRQLEPTPEEIEIAAGFEERAATSGLDFDVGESQLVAMMLTRNAILLVTGDKRAVKALAAIRAAELNRRIACLEQFISTVIGRSGVNRIRGAICSEKQCDKAITASFSCSSPSLSLDEANAGLRSYINALRTETGEMIILSDDLSAVVS